MSIKLFHILFIIFVALFLLGYAAWVLMGGFGSEETAVLTATGWIGGAFGLTLFVYLAFFIRKSRNIIV